MFINPIPDSYMTSPFSPKRLHPIEKVWKSHLGTDLARQPNGNVEVLAAADGTVIRVGVLGTYGNVVIIKHVINGKRYDTVYAHLKNNSTIVKKEQKVKQGQRIATMGNTGASSGPHLHFEIHEGAWVTGRPNAVDPGKYIKFYTKKELDTMQAEIEALQKAVNTLIDSNNDLKAELKKVATAKAESHKKDEAPSDWAKEAVEWAVNMNVSDGKSLKRATTREETITMLYRALEKMEEENLRNFRA